jgi:hypothetical protein
MARVGARARRRYVRRVYRFAFIALVACKIAGPGRDTGGAPLHAPATPRELAPAKPGPATHVVTLTPGSPTPILRGPFEVTTINPGGDLVLAISKTESCADVVWFVYSGGGAAVGDGEVMCARSSASEPLTQGFSGH